MPEPLRLSAVRLGYEKRPSLFGDLGEPWLKRQLGESLNTSRPDGTRFSDRREDLDLALAVGADELVHVLDARFPGVPSPSSLSGRSGTARICSPTGSVLGVMSRFNP